MGDFVSGTARCVVLVPQYCRTYTSSHRSLRCGWIDGKHDKLLNKWWQLVPAKGPKACFSVSHSLSAVLPELLPPFSQCSCLRYCKGQPLFCSTGCTAGMKGTTGTDLEASVPDLFLSWFGIQNDSTGTRRNISYQGNQMRLWFSLFYFLKQEVCKKGKSEAVSDTRFPIPTLLLFSHSA